MRTMAVEIAWGWIRFQPESLLTQWYQTRFGQGSARLRKIGIVALARKLLIALWRFLKTGELPVGAVLKAAGSGERIPEDEQVPRSETRVLGWCGQLVAGHGFAARTAYEEGLSTPGFTGAQSACRIGCVTPARSPRREGRLGPESSTDHEATSTGRGTRSRWTFHRDQYGTRCGRQ
jgi:hypothetical protein